jgi:acyltransferase-like protein
MPRQQSVDLLADRLARLSAEEIVHALGLSGAPRSARAMVGAAFVTIARPLSIVLARFEARIERVGLAAAAAFALGELGATWTRDSEAPPPRGSLLVVANHPGAYDTLVILAALGRDDVAVVAAERDFLHALPALARRLVFVPEGPALAHRRALGFRRALRHLRQGGAVVHFGAGRIEPDPAFSTADVDVLAPWERGTGALVRHAARADARIALALVAGVHSAEAKRLWLTRLAERGGLTTLAPLLQVAMRRYRRVDATVRFDVLSDASEFMPAADDAAVAADVRARVHALLAPSFA